MVAKKSPKKNLENYSSVFVLLGLCLSLFITYGFIEHKSYALLQAEEVTDLTDYNMEDIPEMVSYTKEAKSVPKQLKQEVISDEFDKVDNDTPDIIETPIVEDKPVEAINTTDTTIINLVDHLPTEIENVSDIVEDIPFMSVSNAPIYPGCERKKDKKKCFQDKISKVMKKFDTSLGDELNLSGIQKIYCNFKVNHLGNISDVRIRTRHQSLENEALRLVNKIPQMIPANHNGKAVNIPYTIPIVFKIE